MTVLVTGAAGYIGSHTMVELLNAGHSVVAVDNLVNSHPKAIERVKQISGKDFPFYAVDVCDPQALDKVFAESTIDAVMHFAGLKAVGESVDKPLDYYSNNLNSTLSLCKVMESHGVRKLIFSSSATVYGETNPSPITEDMPKGSCTNPYGWTKWMIEQILGDLCKADPRWSVTLLRYFNPIGAHPSGLIGEDPQGLPTNLFPYITQVAIGKLDHLNIYGNDYDTPDGTGVRDYIHVCDLAKGHMNALETMEGLKVYNLGTGRGYSVLEVVKAFEAVSGRKVPYEVVGRRAGDLACVYSDPAKAQKELGWKAEQDLEAMCRDSWRWQLSNPNGYRE